MIWYAFDFGFVEAVSLALPVLGVCIVLVWLLLLGRWQLHVARHETPGRHPVAVLALRAVGLTLLVPFVLVLGLVGILDVVGWEGQNVAAGVFEVVLAALIAGLGFLAVRRPLLGSSLLLVPPLTLFGFFLLAAAIIERRDPDSLRYEAPGRHARVSVLRTVGLALLAPFVFLLGLVGILDVVGWEGQNVAAGVFEVVLAALITGLGYLAVRRPFLGSSLLLVPPLTLSGAFLLAAAIVERRGRADGRAGSEPVQHEAAGAQQASTGPYGRQAPLSPAHRAAGPERGTRRASRVDRRSRPVPPPRGDRRG